MFGKVTVWSHAVQEDIYLINPLPRYTVTRAIDYHPAPLHTAKKHRTPLNQPSKKAPCHSRQAAMRTRSDLRYTSYVADDVGLDRHRTENPPIHIRSDLSHAPKRFLIAHPPIHIVYDPAACL